MISSVRQVLSACSSLAAAILCASVVPAVAQTEAVPRWTRLSVMALEERPTRMDSEPLRDALQVRGAGVDASIALAGGVYIWGDGRDLSNDSLRYQQYNVGLGLWAPVPRFPHTQVTTMMGYRQAKTDAKAAVLGARTTYKESANLVGIGLRSRQYAAVELSAELYYLSWELSERGLGSRFGLQYFALSDLALGVFYQREGNNQRAGVGLGIYF